MGALAAVLLVLAVPHRRAHPMHTAVAEVVQQDAAGASSVQIRVFADDWLAAVPLPADPVAADSAIARYLRGTFALADRRGRPVRLTWRGAQRTGDVVLLRLWGEVPGGLRGARITSLVLCDRFEDQVNIVRATYGGGSATLLFTRGEASKPLP
jgi:hypothetical protein